MRGSFVLSLVLDVSAIGIMLVPNRTFAPLSTDDRRVTFAKRACFLALLAAGFLIDQYVTHSG